MKKIIHKNQVIITTLAVLIAIAGYISFDRANVLSKNDTLEVNADKAVSDIALMEQEELMAQEESESTKEVAQVENGNNSAENSVESTESAEEVMNPGETVLTSTIIGNSNYAASVKLNREQIRSKNKESLMEIINNESLTQEQKQSAVDEMVTLTEISEKEAAAEMLLEAKGFSNVVVSISGDSCDVVLDMGDVTDAKRAQVEDIVKRKTGISAENIVITAISAGQTTEDQ
ncbi:MAG: SpoIIIAH-like family protein [Lachnospiraceae bacterium]|nr:SpoIIIAH-like family protein [Lachnospiraceae bacterium]MDD6505202.1 SpoIIIAH-like family protein [Lachnospiraceae bacterium]